jgi:hypothetical protein
LEVEDMDMLDIHMVEVRGMDMVEENYHPMNDRPEVKGIDREDSDMGEDMMVEVEMVESEHEGVMLVRHWTGNGAERHQRAHREWEEHAKLRCSEGHTIFACRDSNCST